MTPASWRTQRQVTVSAAEGFALMLSLGWLGVLLRGGSLAAIAFSALPMWRRVDPLAVLTISEEERVRREQDLRSARESRGPDGEGGRRPVGRLRGQRARQLPRGPQSGFSSLDMRTVRPENPCQRCWAPRVARA